MAQKINNQIDVDTRRIIQLYKNDPAKMKILQDNFPEDWQIELADKLRNQGNYDYNPNPMKSMNPEDINKVRELERIQDTNLSQGFGSIGGPSQSQQNLNAVTGILNNDQENFIGYPSDYNDVSTPKFGGYYDPNLEGLRKFLNNGILESQEILPSGDDMMTRTFQKSPYFTMEGALMPAPQMSELEKLMQLSRQQAGR